MTARDPLFVPDVTSPTDARLAMSGLMAAGSGGVAVRTGAMYGPSVFNVTGKSDMSYDVSGGVAVASRGASTGPYIGAIDGVTNVTTTAAPGSGSRYDIIYIQYPDVEQGDADSNVDFGVVQGAASGSPSVPTGDLPTGAVAIAQVLIPSGVTATNAGGVVITKNVPYTVARGAPVPVRDQAERDALTKYAGLVARRLDTGLDNITDGTSWDNFGAVTVHGQSAPLKLKYGSDVSTTSAAGQVQIDTGLTTLLVVMFVNGDGGAHPNAVLSRVGDYSGGEFIVKWVDGDSGSAIGSSSARTDWLALGVA
jgi:hypothetical protein